MDYSQVLSLSTSEFKLSYVFNRPVLAIIALVFFVIYSIVSGVLVYHWHVYGMKNSGILLAQNLFFLVSIILFVMLGYAVYYI